MSTNVNTSLTMALAHAGLVNPADTDKEVNRLYLELCSHRDKVARLSPTVRKLRTDRSRMKRLAQVQQAARDGYAVVDRIEVLTLGKPHLGGTYTNARFLKVEIQSDCRKAEDVITYGV